MKGFSPEAGKLLFRPQEKGNGLPVPFPVLILATRKLPLPGTGPVPWRGGPGRRIPVSGGPPPSRRRPSLPPGPKASPPAPRCAPGCTGGTRSPECPEKRERPDRSLLSYFSCRAEVTSPRGRPCSRARRARSSCSAFRRVTPQPEETFTPTGPQGVSVCSIVRPRVYRRHRVSRTPRKKGNGLTVPFPVIFLAGRKSPLPGTGPAPGRGGPGRRAPPSGGSLPSRRRLSPPPAPRASPPAP